MKQSHVIMSLALVLAAARGASAQPTNPGFETGNFTGWLLAGTSAATVTGPTFSLAPTEGVFQAVLTTAGSATDTALQTFLGLPGGALDGLGNGDATAGAAMRQTFSAAAGTIIAFDWNYVSGEGQFSFFNDFAFTVFNGTLRELADTSFPFPPSPYRSFCVVATGGSDVLGVGVVDVSDTVVDTTVLIDNGRAVVDLDGDGTGDPCDNCPATSNPTQADADGDFIGDACDNCVGPGSDADGDGFCDAVDNCPAIANAGQEDTDFDAIGDACDFCVGFGATDTDGDGHCDLIDNCPSDANPGQEDGDGDGVGDVCDPCSADASPFDFDGDSFCGDPSECPAGCDNCPADHNPGQEDPDGDGVGSVCDNCPADANPGQDDADFDAIGDACDACVGFGAVDSDGDGFCDENDNCPNQPNPTQNDSDGDGFGDACDICPGPGTVDTDSDGTCDEFDACVTDPTEACATLFACTGRDTPMSELYRINPSTGVGFLVGPMGIFGCNGLAFDPTTGVLYALRSGAPVPNSLWTVDTATGAATLVGPTGLTSGAEDIAFRADGALFSYHRSAAALGRVSTTTGAVLLFPSSGLSTAVGGGITFDLAGDLLHANSSTLSAIDDTNGNGALLAPLAFPPSVCGGRRIDATDTHPSGVVYGIANCATTSSVGTLVTIGVPTGTVSVIGSTVPRIDGIAFAPEGACGDGLLNIGEACDDGNLTSGDCCSPTCTFDAAGEPCPIGANPCTINQCDGAGNCVGTLPTGCAAPGTSTLLVNNDPDDSKDRLLFKWRKGPQVDLADLGNPLTTADYTLCLYTGPQHAPLTRLTVAAHATRWSPLSTRGFRYKDSSAAAAGVTKMLLKSGAAGKSVAQVKGKGVNLPDPTFSFLPLPVTAQLVNSETGTCFEASYVAADVKKNDAGVFKALSD
ncbi:MAG: thrombospondin type 3 repeat-containing protein [Candidatus Binatia bacterium]